jgi:hypothetical protein
VCKVNLRIIEKGQHDLVQAKLHNLWLFVCDLALAQLMESVCNKRLAQLRCIRDVAVVKNKDSLNAANDMKYGILGFYCSNARVASALF